VILPLPCAGYSSAHAVLGHLRGTGARSTSRIDQQANSLDWRWPSRTLQSGGTAMAAWAFLSRFHFILAY